jgi:hypothetical protein
MMAVEEARRLRCFLVAGVTLASSIIIANGE